MRKLNYSNFHAKLYHFTLFFCFCCSCFAFQNNHENFIILMSFFFWIRIIYNECNEEYISNLIHRLKGKLKVYIYILEKNMLVEHVINLFV